MDLVWNFGAHGYLLSNDLPNNGNLDVQESCAVKTAQTKHGLFFLFIPFDSELSRKQRGEVGNVFSWFLVPRQ